MQLAKPRYSRRGFPAYRYVPKATPHPEIHPEGHSYQKAAEKAAYLPAEKWQQNDWYLYGVDLFNHGYWWEAHEAWEKLWMLTKKTDLEGLYLQGLIQFAAAMLKLYSGSPGSFANLYREAEKKIHSVLEELGRKKRIHYMGLDVPEWMGRMDTFRQSLQQIEGENMDPLQFASFPVLILDSRSPVARSEMAGKGSH